MTERARATAVTAPGGCLLVESWKPTAQGYVRAPKIDERSPQMIHRLIVEEIIEERLTDKDSIDHLCHNRAWVQGLCDGGPSCPHRRCINPDHLEVVDPLTNWERGNRGGSAPGTVAGMAAWNQVKTECKYGHPLCGKNLYIQPDGRRNCRACRRARVGHRDPATEPVKL